MAESSFDVDPASLTACTEVTIEEESIIEIGQLVVVL
jgi:hypothetical protein